MASLTPYGWIIDAPLSMLGLAIFVLSAIIGQTQILALAAVWTAAFAFATWYCWNIDPRYHSKPRGHR